MVLITYDVNTETPEGRRRLRQVAKTCVDYGQRGTEIRFRMFSRSSTVCPVEEKVRKDY